VIRDAQKNHGVDANRKIHFAQTLKQGPDALSTISVRIISQPQKIIGIACKSV